jgi:hypothetical protein
MGGMPGMLPGGTNAGKRSLLSGGDFERVWSSHCRRSAPRWSRTIAADHRSAGLFFARCCREFSAN